MRQLIEQDLKPLDIVTKNIGKRITTIAILGGSTNAVLQFLR